MAGPFSADRRRAAWPAALGAIAAFAVAAFGEPPAALPEPAPGPAWWPQWRGPAGTGVAPASPDAPALPDEWTYDKAGEAKKGIHWSVVLPPSASTPAIWGDALFVTAQDGDDLLLMRLDRRTGREEWRRTVGQGKVRRDGPLGNGKFHQDHNMASPSPATDGRAVVVHFGNGLLAAYTLAGEPMWSTNLAEEHGSYTIWWGHANTPLLTGDMVVSACMQDPTHAASRPVVSYLAAHDLRTGKQLWLSKRDTGAESEDADSYTTPLLRGAGAEAELVVFGGRALDAYDPATGKQRWGLRGLDGSRSITGPTLADGLILAACGKRGPFHAFRPVGPGKAPEIAWTYTGGTPDTPWPVAAAGCVFFVADNGVATCLDLADGKQLWRERIAGRQFKSSPIVAGGKIYFFSQDGVGTVVEAGRAFRKLGENRLEGCEVLASPAVADGVLYVRASERLFAIGR